MEDILSIMGFLPHQLVQEFFHQWYYSITYISFCSSSCRNGGGNPQILPDTDECAVQMAIW